MLAGLHEALIRSEQPLMKVVRLVSWAAPGVPVWPLQERALLLPPPASTSLWIIGPKRPFLPDLLLPVLFCFFSLVFCLLKFAITLATMSMYLTAVARQVSVTLESERQLPARPRPAPPTRPGRPALPLLRCLPSFFFPFALILPEGFLPLFLLEGFFFSLFRREGFFLLPVFDFFFRFLPEDPFLVLLFRPEFRPDGFRLFSLFCLAGLLLFLPRVLLFLPPVSLTSRWPGVSCRGISTPCSASTEECAARMTRQAAVMSERPP